MVAAFGRWALAAGLALAPSAALADGFLPDWMQIPWSGGQPQPNVSPRDPTTTGGPTRESDKIVRLPARPEDLDCPDVDVEPGGATSRVGGAESASVRYQFDISDIARECDPQGAQFALKVGVAGRLLIGPAGSPGSYATSLHVQVKRDIDEKILVNKTYRIAADTAGAVQAPYRFVTEPILLPLTRARLDQDYSISVGLGAGGEVTGRRRARHRR